MKTERRFCKNAGEYKNMKSGLFTDKTNTKLEFCACRVGTKKLINISLPCHSPTNIS